MPPSVSVILPTVNSHFLNFDAFSTWVDRTTVDFVSVISEMSLLHSLIGQILDSPKMNFFTIADVI